MHNLFPFYWVFRPHRNDSRSVSLWIGLLIIFLTCPSHAVSLGDALDAPGLVWTSASILSYPSESWRGATTNEFPGPVDGHDGIDCAFSYIMLSGSGATDSLETSIQGPAAVKFWCKVEGTGIIGYMISSLRIYVDDASSPVSEFTSSGGSTEWQEVTIVIDSGAHTLTWRHSAGGIDIYYPPSGISTAQLDQVSVTPITTPIIITQPSSSTQNAGSNTTFQVTAYGAHPITYQWRLNTTNLSGGTNSSFVVTNIQPNQAGNYSVVISNSFGTTLSSNATLTVRTNPVITSQPTSRTVNGGDTTTFNVSANGGIPLLYQWRLGSNIVVGATNASYAITNVQPNQAGNYSVVVSNTYGFVMSSNATLTVRTVPVITSQPQPQTVEEGLPALFYAAATGATPLRYQWRFGGIELPGATSSTYTIPEVETNQAGLYSVSVSNSWGQTASSNALLTVIPVPPSPSLGIAVDAPQLVWKTSTNHGWTSQNSITHDGVDAAQCIASSFDGGWMTTKVTGPGKLSFYWRFSSEYGSSGPSGFLGFYIDGQQLQYNYFSFDWTKVEHTITGAGTHSIRWKLEPMYSLPPQAWVDQVTFIPDTPLTLITDDQHLGFNTNGFGFTLGGTAGQTVVVEGSSNLTNWIPLLTNTFGSNSFYFSDPASTGGSRFYRSRIWP